MKQKMEMISENVDRNILWDLNIRPIVQGDRGYRKPNVVVYKKNQQRDWKDTQIPRFCKVI